MASIPHVTVVDVPLKIEPVVVAKMFVPEFSTVVPDYAPNFSADEAADLVDEKDFVEAETKVVRRGRRPKVIPTEGVDTK
jgi:hypothetical protein